MDHRDSTKFNVGCRKPNTTLSFYPGLGPAKNSKATLGRIQTAIQALLKKK